MRSCRSWGGARILEPFFDVDKAVCLASFVRNSRTLSGATLLMSRGPDEIAAPARS